MQFNNNSGISAPFSCFTSSGFRGNVWRVCVLCWQQTQKLLEDVKHEAVLNVRRSRENAELTSFLTRATTAYYFLEREQHNWIDYWQQMDWKNSLRKDWIHSQHSEVFIICPHFWRTLLVWVDLCLFMARNTYFTVYPAHFLDWANKEQLAQGKKQNLGLKEEFKKKTTLLCETAWVNP